MSNAVEYDFASVGETESVLLEKERAEEETAVKINFNPKTPLEFGAGTSGLFVMNTTLSNAIRDNLKNLLLTNWGERVGQYKFGANLKPLTTELGTKSFDSEALRRIRDACRLYMPYISLGTMKIENLSEQTTAALAAVKLTITYSAPSGGVVGDKISITLMATA